MRQGFMRFLGVINILLAGGLVAVAMWLYGQEHETRALERQIRALERATKLEEETIRRLEIEWQRLRNPMRLEPLVRLKLDLVPPDPLAVLSAAQALALLPLRPPPAEQEAQVEPTGPTGPTGAGEQAAGISGGDAGALSSMAARAAGSAVATEGTAGTVDPAAAADSAMEEALPVVDEAASVAAQPPASPGRGDDALGGLIRGILPDGGGQ